MLSRFLPALLVISAGCGPRAATSSLDSAGDDGRSLAEARQGFKTSLARREQSGEPLPNPPSDLFQKVDFDSPAGKMAAFISPDPGDGAKHPLVIWVTGGDYNTLDDSMWDKTWGGHDQTASGFREAGILMLFPTLRGGNLNPGLREGFYGEVDDIVAAAEFAGSQKFVDAKRIYLGGFSNGATLALLVAAMSDRFRAVFAIGPVEDVHGYHSQYLPFDTSNPREFELRSPIRWLHSIKVPVFVFDGTVNSNLESLRALQRSSKNPKIHFHVVQNADHVGVLASTARVIASKILDDTGSKESNLRFADEELSRAFTDSR
jgi:acetyl esterase/lipase